MLLTLQQITDAYGNWVARSNPDSGGMEFSASTKYDRIPDYRERYQVEVSKPEIRYQQTLLPPPTAISSVATVIRNDSAAEQKQTFTHSEAVTREFNWSTTETVEVGIDVTVTAGIPKVAEVEGSFSTKFSLATTNGASETTEKTFGVHLELTVPPYTTLSAQQIVMRQTYDIPWTAEVILTRYVAVWFKNRWAMHGDPNDQHFLWFIPIAEVFRACAEVNLVDLTGYENLGWGVKAIASGKFTGAQGVSSHVNVDEHPTVAEQDAAPVTRTIPIGLDGGPAIVGVDPTDGEAPAAVAEPALAGASGA
jgi:hypothetical protein